MIVLPFDAILFNDLITLSAIMESNPVVGSSQNRIEGLVKVFMEKRIQKLGKIRNTNL